MIRILRKVGTNMKNNSAFKFIGILLVLCMFLSFGANSYLYAENGENPEVPEAVSDNVLQDVLHTYINVGLLYSDTAVDIVKLNSPKGFIHADISKDGWGVKQEITNYTELYVINYNGVVCLMSEDASLLIGLWKGDGIMAAGASLDEMIITVNGVSYRDGVCFSLNDDNKICVNNYVSVEHYLWGVISSEMSSSYPIEALKAQAVSARSYTYANIGKHNALGFDLCRSSDCQVYGGVSAETDSCTAACKATEGFVMKYNGTLATGYYYANSGGYTMNSEDVWVAAIPYLRSIKDEYSPELKWTLNYTFEEVRTAMENAGYALGNVNNVKITKRADNGRSVISLTVVGSNSSATVSKGEMKRIFKLKSQNFDVTTSIASIINGTAPAQYIYVLGAEGEPVKINVKDTVITDGITTLSGAGLNWNELALDGAVGAPTDIVTFSGSGSGHGVGLSQTGAKAMAEADKSFIDILAYYYTGISIEVYTE